MYIVNVNLNKTKPDQVYEISKHLSEQYPNEEFIFIPDFLSIMEMSKEELKTVIDNLTEYYEGLK